MFDLAPLTAHKVNQANSMSWSDVRQVSPGLALILQLNIRTETLSGSVIGTPRRNNRQINSRKVVFDLLVTC